ncbi:Ribonuclease BN [Balamuthia mandrillaris]
MKCVTFLGTSAATPTKCRNVTSHALQFLNGRAWLFDCGEGTQHQILKSKDLKAPRIDAIFITHLHGDHLFGLPGLLASLSLVGGERQNPVLLYGPPGIKEYVRASIDSSVTYLTYGLEVIELDTSKNHTLSEPGLSTSASMPMKVTAHPIVHKVPCLGYVVEEPERAGALDAKKAASLGAKGKEMGLLKAGKDVTLSDGRVIKASDVIGPTRKGKKVVLLGDTSDASSVLEAGQGCDLLVHEATYDASLREKAVEGGHSTSQMAGRFAKELAAKKLILTHFSMRYTSSEGSQPQHQEKDAEEEKEEGGPLTVEQLCEEARAECPETLVVAALDLESYDV